MGRYEEPEDEELEDEELEDERPERDLYEEMIDERAEQQLDLMRNDGWTSEEIRNRETHLGGQYLGPKGEEQP